MVKFTLLLCGAAMLAGLAMPTRNAAAAPADTKDDLKSLVQKYLAADGLYTKKTTIGLNEAAKEEHVEYFHASLVQAKRTTYYAPNKLLLAAEDGSIPVGSGSYYFDSADSKVHRAGALEGSDESNMWSNLDAGYVAYKDEVTKLEDKFVTLNTFLADNYFSAWGYNDGTYYYDLTAGDKEKDAEGAYKCAMWNDFLAFCAPMLYAKSGNYLSAKSLTISEAYDTNGNSYLMMSMYLDDADAGKLEQSYLAQARIYKGNSIFQEDFTKSFFVMRGAERLGKMLWEDESKKELVLKNVALEKGDAIKLWSTDNQWHGVSAGFEHNLTVGISKNTKLVDDQDNYLACEAANFDFYAKFDDDWNYTGTYAHDQSAKNIYLQDTWDKGGIGMHYWGANIIGTEWDYTPWGVNTYKKDSGHDMYRFVVPGATENIIIKYDNNQSNDITLGTDNAYWVSNGAGGKLAGNSYTWQE